MWTRANIVWPYRSLILFTASRPLSWTQGLLLFSNSLISCAPYIAVEVAVEGDYLVNGGGLPGTYKGLQFHLHWGAESDRGSEHTVNGKAYPAEVTTKYMQIFNMADTWWLISLNSKEWKNHSPLSDFGYDKENLGNHQIDVTEIWRGRGRGGRKQRERIFQRKGKEEQKG